MINQLILTKIKVNQHLLIGLVGICVLAFLINIFTVDFSEMGSIWILLILWTAAIGTIIHIRGQREKIIRLFSQLPVSDFQVGISVWCFKLLVLCIPLCFWLAAGLWQKNENISDLLILVSIVFFVGASLLAVLSILKNIINHIIHNKFYPEWVRLFIILILMITFVISLIVFSSFIFDKVYFDWMTFVFYLFTPFCLITLDIYLHKHARSYLG